MPSQASRKDNFVMTTVAAQVQRRKEKVLWECAMEGLAQLGSRRLPRAQETSGQRMKEMCPCCHLRRESKGFGSERHTLCLCFFILAL